jgi:long-chain fatty acid transport protein
MGYIIRSDLYTISLTLRGGWNYGKSPVQNEDVDWNLVSTAIVEHHVMLGLGYRVTKNFEVDLGYGHAFEKEFTSPVTGNKIKMSEDWVDLMLSYRF